MRALARSQKTLLVSPAALPPCKAKRQPVSRETAARLKCRGAIRESEPPNPRSLSAPDRRTLRKRAAVSRSREIEYAETVGRLSGRPERSQADLSLDQFFR